MCLLRAEIVNDTYTIVAIQCMRFFCAVNIPSWWYPRTDSLSRHPAKYSASSTCEITSEIFRAECGTSEGVAVTPFFKRSTKRLAEHDFGERARTDAEISAVPRRDLPHNDARSPSSINAPIFPFNKLMPQCHSIFRLLVRHEEIGRTRTNRTG